MNKTYKIAVVTNDNKTVSLHFGSASNFEVFTIENDAIINRETREKFNPHAAGMHHHQHGDSAEHSHGHGQEALNKHNAMIENIKDCEYVITRGMGYGMYYHFQEAGIKPIITEIGLIEQAVESIVNGTAVNHTEKLH